MSAQIQISSEAVKAAMLATWQQILAGAQQTAKANAATLQALAAELLPHVTALAQEAASADPAVSGPARRALGELEGVVAAAAERLGFADLAKASSALAAGAALAAQWLGVLIKAVVL